MRYICLAAILLTLPLTADAQQQRSNDQGADRARPAPKSEQHQPDQRKPDQRSSPLPWWEQQQAPAWETKHTPAWELNRTPRWETGNQPQQQRDQAPRVTQHRGRQYAPSVVYVMPGYGYFPGSIPTTTQFTVTAPPPVTPITFAPPPEPAAPLGALRIEVEPRELLQIFVDGVYVGTPADHGDQLELTPGTRHIELRAREYRSLFFNANILDGRSITYRGSLEPVESTRPVAPAPTVPLAPKAPYAPQAPASVMYLIPGCYLGNVSPKTVVLPAGCDISKLTTITP